MRAKILAVVIIILALSGVAYYLRLFNFPPLYRLCGKLFFDYNGNGKQDPEEPDIPNVVIALDGRNATATNSTGWYVINDVPRGSHMIRPYPPKNFRYMCDSDAESRSVKESYEILLVNDTRKDVGLMEGFLILPFPFGRNYEIVLWFDRDPRLGHVKNWKGESDTVSPVRGTDIVYSHQIRVEDGHYAVDYGFDEETPIVASDAGTILKIERDIRQIVPDDHIIHIAVSNGLILDYGHVRPVKELRAGQRVHRGQMIGYSVLHSTPYRREGYLLHMCVIQKNGAPLDPYPDLWTTRDFDKARTSLAFGTVLTPERYIRCSGKVDGNLLLC